MCLKKKQTIFGFKLDFFSLHIRFDRTVFVLPALSDIMKLYNKENSYFAAALAHFGMSVNPGDSCRKL